MIAPRVVLTRPHARRAMMSPSEKARELPSPEQAPDVPAAEKTREGMIRDAAYLLAERRGFCPGKELDDWLEAEQQIDRWLAAHASPRR